MENLISFIITDEELQVVNDSINKIKEILEPKLVTLTNEERQMIPKMGDKTLSFVTKAVELAGLNKEFVPRYVNLEDLKVDLEAAKFLQKLKLDLEPVVSMIDDSMLLSGSEAYVASLLIYNESKGAAKVGIKRAKEAYHELRSRFPRNSRNEVEKEEENIKSVQE